MTFFVLWSRVTYCCLTKKSLSKDSIVEFIILRNSFCFVIDWHSFCFYVIFPLFVSAVNNCSVCFVTGPNAISVSLSPMGRYVMVGLASRRILLHQISDHMVAQVFRLQQPHAGETSMRVRHC